MERNRGWSTKPCRYLVIGLVLITAAGCNSGPANAGKKAAGGSSEGAGAQVDVMCIGERINNPPEPFHYSYKYTDASGATNKEADITPQKMDITITDNSGSHSYHGVRSDEASWNRAVLDLSGLNVTALSARLNFLNNSSAIVQQGTEAKNGYSTTKYAIDTTSANSSDKAKFEKFFGKGSFEKGTAWVADDGCTVNLVLDEASQEMDGTVNKAHYEMARIKK